jgi:hypothetical protein
VAENVVPLRPTEVQPWQTSGAPRPDTPPIDPDAKVREQLLALARYEYEAIADMSDELWCVPRVGPRIARPLAGRGTVAYELSAKFEEHTGKAPSRGDKEAVLDVLAGNARQRDRHEVHRRVADIPADAHGGRRLVVDLGIQDGKCAVISARGWTLRTDPDTTFSRSAVMLPMALPEEPATPPAVGEPFQQLADLLRPLVNANDELLRLIVAWCVLALLNVERPILWITGQQGSGKSNTARMIVELLDPSASPLRSFPKDDEDWHRAALASVVVALDNISRLSPTWSDILCRAVTGDSFVKRKRFTDNELSVGHFRIALIITSISPQAARGDLVQRLLPVQLEPLNDGHEMPARELQQLANRTRPAMVAALFSSIAQLLGQLDKSDGTPPGHRLADFAQALRAIDKLTGWDTLASFQQLSGDALADLLEGDTVGRAVVELVEANHGTWSGTMNELLKAMEKYRQPEWTSWPHTARAMSNVLASLAPTLRQHRLHVTKKRSSSGTYVELTTV